jgi:DNA polymerase-3 subunit beta
VEGRFPKYEDAFPDGVATKIGDIDPDLLAAALGQVKATEDDASRGVDFLFSTGLLGLTHTSERGRSEVEFPITYEGRDIPVTFDARYLSDVVKGLSGHPLTVEIIDHKSPIVVRTEDGFASVIMPLTRDR